MASCCEPKLHVLNHHSHLSRLHAGPFVTWCLPADSMQAKAIPQKAQFLFFRQLHDLQEDNFSKNVPGDALQTTHVMLQGDSHTGAKRLLKVASNRPRSLLGGRGPRASFDNSRRLSKDV